MENSKELVDAVLESCQEINGKRSLTCSNAFQIAEKFNIQPKKIGDICNAHSVRICNCQLGCFK